MIKTTDRNPDNSTQFGPLTEDYFNGDGQLEKRVRNAGSTDPAEVKNYYIRSSILNKVISETDGTGRKLKTFVPANGTTLATQTLYYTGQTPTESLTFNHTDASGTGAQQTTASGALIGNTTYSRTGEYSPMGRNIADAGPYISLDTYEEPGQNGIDLFGSGEGYRPGQNTYTLEGMRVSAAHFMAETVNSGRTGGMFGLMQIAFRMSNREKGRWYRTTTERISGTGTSVELLNEDGTIASSQSGLTSAPQIRIQTTLLRFVYDTDWSGLLTIEPQTLQKQNEPLPDVPTLREKLVKRLDDKDNNGRCRKFMEAVLKNLGIKKTVEDIFDEVAKNGGFIIADDVEKKYGTQAISYYGKKAPYPIGIQSLDKGEDNIKSEQRVQRYIDSLIHELIHRAGVSEHLKFGQAAYDALNSEDQKLKPLPKKSEENYEKYFNDRFKEKCLYDPYSKEIK